MNPNKILTAAEYVIEKNPGPPRRRQNQRGQAEEPARQARDGLQQYVMTRVYLRGRDAVYADERALARFNNWVDANAAQIDPAEQRICHVCGEAALRLCEHRITAPPAYEPPPPPPAPAMRVRPITIVQRFARAFKQPEFDLGQQDAQFLAGFSNDHIHQSMLIPELYNYITVNQQTSYAVNGRDSRDLRLAHSHRLAHRWSENSNHSETLVQDTVFANRFKFTIQRACDQAENRMLYKYHDPTQNFGLAWLPTYLVMRGLFLMAFGLLLLIFVDLTLPSTLPPFAEVVVWHVYATARSLLMTVKAGSVQLCKLILLDGIALLRVMTHAVATHLSSLYHWAVETAVAGMESH